MAPRLGGMNKGNHIEVGGRKIISFVLFPLGSEPCYNFNKEKNR